MAEDSLVGMLKVEHLRTGIEVQRPTSQEPRAEVRQHPYVAVEFHQEGIEKLPNQELLSLAFFAIAHTLEKKYGITGFEQLRDETKILKMDG